MENITQRSVAKRFGVSEGRVSNLKKELGSMDDVVDYYTKKEERNAIKKKVEALEFEMERVPKETLEFEMKRVPRHVLFERAKKSKIYQFDQLIGGIICVR